MIEQKDLKGNLINTYPTKTAAANCLGLNESSIRRAIKYNRTVMGKFKFSRVEEEEKKVLFSPAKILFLDIETSPLLAMVFQKQVWKARISYDRVLQDYFMLTWAGKFLGDDKIYSDKLTSQEALQENDYRIVKSLWHLLDEADIVIIHNAPFDIPNINTRSVKYKINPPSPFKIIDTLKVAQNQFGFTHNSLGALANFFGFEGKDDVTFELWKRCLFGDNAGLLEMEDYNIQDVLILEDVYLCLRSYIKGHANLDLYVDDDTPSCPHCGSKNLTLLKDKYFYTQAVRYQVYRCDDCGALSRGKTGVKYTNKKLISPIPR